MIWSTGGDPAIEAYRRFGDPAYLCVEALAKVRHVSLFLKRFGHLTQDMGTRQCYCDPRTSSRSQRLAGVSG